jgi:hypothetical protein
VRHESGREHKMGDERGIGVKIWSP